MLANLEKIEMGLIKTHHPVFQVVNNEERYPRKIKIRIGSNLHRYVDGYFVQMGGYRWSGRWNDIRFTLSTDELCQLIESPYLEIFNLQRKYKRRVVRKYSKN